MENDSHLDNSDFQNITKLNLDKIDFGISKIGYSDGITKGRALVFQNGFDIGYKDGFRMAFEISKYEAAADILIFKHIDINLTEEVQEYREHCKEECKKTKFLDDINRNLELDVITTEHNNWVDQKVERLKKLFPNFSNLLS